MKSTMNVLILGSIALVSQFAFGATPVRTAEVETKAWLYSITPEGYAAETQLAVLSQGSVVRFMTCPAATPKTAAEMRELLKKCNFFDADLPPSSIGTFVHQTQGDRYVKVTADVNDFASIGGKAIYAGLMGYVFQPADPSKLDVTVSYMSYQSGENPQADTGKITYLMTQAFTLKHPALKAVAVEQ